MFGGLGMWEVVLIFLVVLLLFGAKRLPEIGSSLGKGIREFKGSLRDIEGELRLPDAEDDAHTPKPPGSEDVAGGSEEEGTDEEENGSPRRLTSSQ